MLAFGALPAAAAQSVDLELVLAVDVSRSIDADEARLQRQGYATALTDARIIGAIRRGRLGRIAATYVEWAETQTRQVVVEWTVIDDEASARAFASNITRAAPTLGFYTSISGAIEFALPMFDDNGFEGRRRVIDISADGANNNGRLVTIARDQAVAAGITINGLPIINDRPSPGGWPPTADLDLYFQECVIGGSSAFIVVAESFAAFAAAIRRKLIIEIADLAPPGRPLLHRVAVRRQAPPCDIGEQRMRQRRLGIDDLN
ncbi:MAG: DUF1194 domain-containing protein [Rhodospirillales bacterium]|jgi:hypothetical protein|nr:DUF1194 domain-containing protein [Rhodospirillales bacterium]MDP6883753.1 DUF1194 domain-containing protein [Rhodospirillales bacterium]